MKKLSILTACLLLLIGCGTKPDFTKENTIRWKRVGESGRAQYELKGASINGFGCGFYATQDFARVGDIIVMKDGVITVKRGDK